MMMQPVFRSKQQQDGTEGVFQFKDDLMFLGPADKNKVARPLLHLGNQWPETQSKWREKFLCPEQ